MQSFDNSIRHAVLAVVSVVTVRHHTTLKCYILGFGDSYGKPKLIKLELSKIFCLFIIFNDYTSKQLLRCTAHSETVCGTEARGRKRTVNPDRVRNSVRSTAVTGFSNQKSNLVKKPWDHKLLACPDHRFILKKVEEAKTGTCTLLSVMSK